MISYKNEKYIKMKIRTNSDKVYTNFCGLKEIILKNRVCNYYFE